jgi:hypothetical protein
VRLATVARTEDIMLHPGLGSSSSPSPARLEGASSAELEDGFHPQKPEEEAGLSHPFLRGRARCIAYVCQDLFPHIC